MPALGLELGISGAMIGLILSANRISRLIFNFVAGGLYARLGPRRTMAAALAIETTGMLMFSVALMSSWPTAWLLAGRFVNGIGMAFLLIGAQAAVLAGSDHANRGTRTLGLGGRQLPRLGGCAGVPELPLSGSRGTAPGDAPRGGRGVRMDQSDRHQPSPERQPRPRSDAGRPARTRGLRNPCTEGDNR